MYKELFATLFINGFASVLYYYLLNEFEYRFNKKDSYFTHKIRKIEQDIHDIKVYLDNLEEDLKEKNKETEKLKESHSFLNKNLEHYININYDTMDYMYDKQMTDDFYIKPTE